MTRTRSPAAESVQNAASTAALLCAACAPGGWFESADTLISCGGEPSASVSSAGLRDGARDFLLVLRCPRVSQNMQRPMAGGEDGAALAAVQQAVWAMHCEI